LIKPYMSPTQLFTRIVKSLCNSGLVLIDVIMIELNEEQRKTFYNFELPEGSSEDYKRYIEYLELGPCYAILFRGKDSLYKMRKVIGVNNCPEEEKYAYLRFSSWKNEIENGLYFAEHYTTVEVLKEMFFPKRNLNNTKICFNLQLDPLASSRMLVKDINMSPLEEVGLLIFSPTIVMNGEYIYPLGLIMKEKCHIGNIRKGRIQEEDIKTIFSSSKHSVGVLVTLIIHYRMKSLRRVNLLL